MNSLIPSAVSGVRIMTVAGFGFALGLLVAVISSLGFLPAQHPLGLLGALPGGEGVFYRSFLYWLPAVAGLWVTAALWSTALAFRRSGRLALMLVAISALGFAAMGFFPLHLEDAGGRGAGGHAAAWLVWLSAWLAALILLACELSVRVGKVSGALAGLLAVVTLVLAGGLDGVFTGPVAQLLCWGGWFAGLAGLAALFPAKSLRS